MQIISPGSAGMKHKAFKAWRNSESGL